jgi:hypothetical protein
MTWRVHLPHPIVRRIDLLSGEKTVAAVWTQLDRVHFYDQRNGASLGERVVEKLAFTDRHDERWRLFLDGLKAPNDRYLPLVRAQGMTIHVTEDGRNRLLQTQDGLFIEILGKESALTIQGEAQFIALDMDRQSGAIAALDSRGKLHLYQQRLYAGVFETGLQVEADMTPRVLVANEGRQIVLSDGQSLIILDELGTLRKRHEFHYPLGAMAISPDGKWIATSDAEIGVIRLYNGMSLMPAFQRYAIDLAADSRRVNPAAGTQLSTSSPSALALTSRGVLGFALGALLCVTSVTKMRPVPAPQG